MSKSEKVEVERLHVTKEEFWRAVERASDNVRSWPSFREPPRPRAARPSELGRGASCPDSSTPR
jgi:hypothetical protein